MAKSEPSSKAEIGRELDLLTRRERARLIAGLVNRLGSHRLELAEDVAQDALLTAVAIWPYRGVPENPGAWLARVARNKALDRLRRQNREQIYNEESDTRVAHDEAIADTATIADPELRLMFLSCHPALNGIDQLALTLRIVSGFTAREIGGLFLSSETGMAQRLSRGKRRLRRLDTSLVDTPTVFEIESRLAAVLKVVYLMFSLGYAPRSGAQLIRRDVAHEALRLARELAARGPTATPAAGALAALLCFQSSRLQAREDAEGRPVLLRDQNRAAWDSALIDTGMSYLRDAMNGGQVSRYHLEAGIASIYATAPTWERVDWQAILGCYDRLEAIIDSPVVAINGCVARAFAGAPEQALRRLESLRGESILASYAPYHIARAEVLRLLGREADASESYCAAIDSGASIPVTRYLEARLATSL